MRKRIEFRFPARADCFDCTERERSPWCGLSTADLDARNFAKRCSVHAAGEVVVQQGDECSTLLVIQEGMVAVRKSDPAGRSLLLRLCFAGDSLGYRELLSGQPHSNSGEALTDARVCHFGREAVQEALAESPELSERFLHKLSADLARAELDLLLMATWPLRARIAQLWLALKDRFGTGSPDGGITLVLPLSQLHIATLLGVRRETVARSIRDLADDGVVQVAGSVVVIPDLDVLMDEVDRASA